MTRLATIYSRATVGMDAPLVRVEVHIAGGLPGMTLVGMPDGAAREARDRVRAALQSSGFTIPPSRITINLAPADLPKQRGGFDLAIALGVLQAADLMSFPAASFECLAELGLDGRLRPVSGVLPAAMACAAAARQLIVAPDNLAEAQLADEGPVRAAADLRALCAALSGETPWPIAEACQTPLPPRRYPDLADVRGQPQGRRALEIAAAGGHNLLLYGPPGSGKSMLAERLPGLLPPMAAHERLEVAMLQSLSSGGFCPHTFGQRPYRQPHHSASAVALVGGGSIPRPGEISLASRGVLCLDELPEFPRAALEMLREPLESGEVRLARAYRQVRYPARFQLVATMNPCPCGYLGDTRRNCRCTVDQVQRYRQRLSGPLLDRIDMHLAVMRPDVRDVLSAPLGEPSTVVAQRVQAAQARALARQGEINAQLPAAAMESMVPPDSPLSGLLVQAAERLQLSARSLHRALRVARTIADLAGRDALDAADLAEALSLRGLDRQMAGAAAG